MTSFSSMAEGDIKVVGLSAKKQSKTDWRVVGAIIGIVVLALGVIAGILLVRQQQDIREQAAGNCQDPASIVQCPRSDGIIVTCNPPDQNNNAQLQRCDVRGRKELCGVTPNIREYCCPAPGGQWTTDMTACSCNIAAPTGLSVEQISPTSVKLKWTAGTGASVTRLWVGTTSNPTSACSSGTSATCLVNNHEMAASVTEYELTNLSPNTKYYWRIMSWASEGCDEAASVANFTTQSGTATSTPTSIATSTATAKATSTATSKATATATSTATAKATSTATSKATATAKATSTATATKTPTSQASASATAFPVPETGAEWPTVLGVGFGVIMLLVSLSLAL